MYPNFNMNRKGINASDVQGRTLLYRAVEAGDYSRVRELIEKGAALNLHNKDGHTPLHAAVKNNDLKMVNLLLDRGMNVNGGRSQKVTTPLMLAVKKDIDVEIFKALLKKRPNLLARDRYGKTLPHHWAEGGDSYRFKLLQKMGVDFKSKTTKGAHMPVHLAARAGNLSAIECLESYGVDLLSKNEAFETALHIAAEMGHLEMLEVLIRGVLKRKENDPLKTLEEGKTPLMAAAQSGCFKAVERLIETGFNPNEKDHAGHIALHYAVRGEHEKIVKYLVRNGADVKGFHISSRSGDDLLHTAAQSGHIGIISFLVMAGAEIDKKNGLYVTPLVIAVNTANTDAVKAILSSGANPDYADMYGNRAIDFVAGRGSHSKKAIEIARELIKAGADIGVSPNMNMSYPPIHMAIKDSCGEMIDLFLEQKGILEQTDHEKGFTPFLLAVDIGNAPLVEKILAKGGKASAKDRYNRNALHIALENGRLSLFKKLSKKIKFDPNDKDIYGKNLFLRAVSIGTTNAVKMANSIKGVDKSAKDIKGNTALHILCSFKSDDTFNSLIGEVDAHALNEANMHGNTPLHIAAMSNSKAGAITLVEMGAKLDFENEKGLTPLAQSVISESYDVSDVLLKAGADHTKTYDNGESLAHMAVKMSDIDMLRVLHENEVALEGKNNQGDTPLHIAVAKKNITLIKFLVEEAGVELSIQNQNRKTPVHIAVDLGEEDLLSYFKEKIESREISRVMGKKGQERRHDKKNRP